MDEEINKYIKKYLRKNMLIKTKKLDTEASK